MKNKTIALIIALIITVIFLFFVLRPGAFNMIPYFIHESIWPGGSGESIFIRIFDILFGLLLFGGVYKITSKILK